jgi:L-methionine (R)-S-oxide reductase
MHEEIKITSSLSKEDKYKSLLPQIESLVSPKDSFRSEEDDLIANLGNLCAALKYSMDDFLWVGVYFKKGGELLLGPFQGPAACTRIEIPNGVCGACTKRKETVIVPDVNQFPGHIACSSESKSEIVVPVFKDSEVIAVLDVDSGKLDNFDLTDKTYLEKISTLITNLVNSMK